MEEFGLENIDVFMGIIAPYINFAIFLILAIKFFKKPILTMVSGRKNEYEKLLKEAQAAKAEALVQKQNLDLRLARLNNEIDEIKTSVRHSAELEAKEMVESSRKLAEHLKAEAERLALAQIKNAEESMRSEIVHLVNAKVAERLRRDLSEDQHHKLIAHKIKDLGSIKAEA